MNLVTNAYHALENTSEGKIKLTLSQVNLGKEQPDIFKIPPGEYALLKCIDNGSGISQDIIDKIFDPYFTTKSKNKGTGLGLSVVQGIIKSFNGDIKVYSEEGLGTEISIYLPLYSQSREVIEKEVTQTPLSAGEHILIVDDESFVLKVEKEILEHLGYRVSAFNNSTEALTVFAEKKEDFDLVISDLTMPVMNGLELSREIKEIRDDIPIIICTGFSDQIDRAQGKMTGISEYLLKPIIKNDIAEAIHRQLKKI
jgi:CheY-like chemotaxis protein